MTTITRSALAVLASALLAAPLHAETSSAPIEIKAPWLRATPKNAPVIGGYATITNKGSAEDRIIGASIPVAAKAEVHTMSMKDGVMHMERLEDGLAVAPGATVTLEPGGNHLMFLKPTEQVKEGQSIKGAIVFEKAGAVPVTFAVGAIGAKSAPGTHAMPGMSGMSGMKMK